MTVTGQVEEMIATLENGLNDAAKHDRGNAAAGRRLRKALQSIKVQAQACRVQIQQDKKTR